MATATKTISQKIREESFSNGFLDGEKNKSIEIAKDMLEDNIDIKIISKYTGLTPEKLQKLEKEL